MFSLNSSENSLASGFCLSNQSSLSANLLPPSNANVAARQSPARTQSSYDRPRHYRFNRLECRDRSTRQLFDWRRLSPVGFMGQDQPVNDSISAIKPSPERELTTLFNQLSSTDTCGLPDISGVCTDVFIAEYKLRLYALVWTDEMSDEPEPCLFLLLGPVAGSYLPIDTQLGIQEEHLLLTAQKLRWTRDSSYLCSQVLGSWKVKFTVEIVLPNALPLALPPLAVVAGGVS